MKALSTLFIAALTVLPILSKAQFGEGSMFLGPHIGLSAYQSAPTFGAYFETAINKPGELGDGILGISGRLDYFSYDYDAGPSYNWSYTWINIGAYCNYHFKVGDGKFDPFLGLGLVYHNVSVDYGEAGQGTFSDSWGSGVGFDLNAGARYFFSKNMALRALLGYNTAFLVVGIDFGI